MPMTEYAAESGSNVIDAPWSDGATSERMDRFEQLQLDVIVPSLTNPRTIFDDAKLAELAESIRSGGVHQPILVRPLPASRLDETSTKLGRAQRETHEIVSGERRWRACKLAGLQSIPALVRHLSDEQVLEAQIVENLQRDGLTDLEEAEGYQRLVDQAGIAKEAIGAKIGKSRSYVYQHLKLLDLDPAGREALRQGRIDYSKALLIARVPVDTLQIKALGQATGDDNYGHALTVKELQTWLQTNVMLPLKRTRFDIKDVTLREGAGACPDCQKRTGANPDLFSDVDSADLCTDPTCYHDKEKTSDERAFEAAEREGKKVIDSTKAEKLHVPYSTQWLKGYQLLDERPDYSLGVDGGTLRRILGKHCPEPIRVRNPETGLMAEVLPTDQVKKLIKEHGLSRDAKQAERMVTKSAEIKQAEQRKPIEERADFVEQWQAAALAKADEFLKSQPVVGTPDLLRAWLIEENEADWERGDALRAVFDIGQRGADVIDQRIVATSDEDMPRLLLRYMLHVAANRYEPWSDEAAKRQGPRSALHEILHLTGVDLAAIQAEIKRKIESDERADALEGQVQAPPEPKKAPRAKASPAAPAKRGGRKPSQEEVQGQIAEALQALDEGGGGKQDQAPDGAVLEEGAAPAAPAPTFGVGDIARVKIGSKSAGGKALKTVGRVGRVVGTGDNGAVHLRYGARSHELVVVKAEQLERYKADPLIGSKVRVLSTGALQWKTGEVRNLRDDGWGIDFDDGEAVGGFTSDELEVLA